MTADDVVQILAHAVFVGRPGGYTVAMRLTRVAAVLTRWTSRWEPSAFSIACMLTAITLLSSGALLTLF